MTPGVRIVEVGPRDGLQNEPVLVAPQVKVAFIESLALAGHRRIEAGALVSPKAVPQMADTEAVLAALSKPAGVRMIVLVPNEKGLERALAAKVDEIAVFTAASETFSRKNINAGIEESLARFESVIQGARSAGVAVRGYVSTILHCPFEGRVDPAVTIRVSRRLLDLGCDEISLGETLGRATPAEVRDLCARVRGEGFAERAAGHFHDTFGMGVANVHAAFEAGIRTFDASGGGLGGCPFAPGAAGNVATEDLLFLFEGLGVTTGIDLELQVKATAIIEAAIGRPLPGRTYRALRR